MDIRYHRKRITQEIEENLNLAFKRYNLKLTFRKVNMNNLSEGIVFLDVFHIIDCNAKNEFFTTDFLNFYPKICFLNGRSHFLLQFLNPLFTGKAKKIKRLNEKDVYYHKSLNRPKEKYINSNINKDMFSNVIQIAKS